MQQHTKNIGQCYMRLYTLSSSENVLKIGTFLIKL